MAISVIIPSYRNPEYLDLCLKSATDHQEHDNQIIVVLDGFAEESEHVIEKYPGIDVMSFPENRGQNIAHNTGVTLADNDYVLVINDDNVLPPKWDTALETAILHTPNAVMAPNQVEPRPSIFASTVIKDLGTTPETFDMAAFVEYSQRANSDQWRVGLDGQTWPLFIKKKTYMMHGGFDISYPGAAVADWDLMFRFEQSGLECIRIFNTEFYHFASAATRKTPEMADAYAKKEALAFEYFYWKWGFLPGLDQYHNKRPREGVPRGFSF